MTRTAAGVDAGQVDGDLERVVGFVDVERRGALAGQRLGAERAAELEEDLADFVGEIADFGREGDGVDARAHGCDDRIRPASEADRHETR